MLVCTYFLFLPVGLYVLSPSNILAFLSVPLKLLAKFSFIWITPTWATWLHMISLSILISFFLNPSFKFPQIFIEHLPFPRVKIGIFLTLGPCFQPSCLPALSPHPSFSPCPPRSGCVPLVRQFSPGATGPWRSLIHEHLSPPSLAWLLVINGHVTWIKLLMYRLPWL